MLTPGDMHLLVAFYFVASRRVPSRTDESVHLLLALGKQYRDFSSPLIMARELGFSDGGKLVRPLNSRNVWHA